MSLRLLALAVYYFVIGAVFRALRQQRTEPQRALPAGWAPAAPTDELEALARFSGCIACGRCDTTFSAYDRTARTEFNGPSQLPLAFSRDLSQHGMLVRYLKHLSKGDLEALERVCPVGIPFGELLEVLQRRAERLAEDDPRPLPRPRHHPG